MKVRWLAFAMMATAGCAQPPAPAYDSVLPGTIGAAVRPVEAGLAVTALRGGSAQVLHVPVEQLDLTPGA